MKHNEMRIRSLTKTIMGLMNTIEDRRGLMFQEIDKDLEARIFETIDSKNAFRLSLLITELETIENGSK